MTSSKCIVKTFSYEGEKFGTFCKILYDVEIPIPEYANEDELLGHLASQQKLPLAFHSEVRSKFRSFIVAETQKFFDDAVEADFVDALRQSNWDIEQLPRTSSLCGLNDDSVISFADQFMFLMKNSTVKQLSQIVKEELDMSSKMLAIVRARDFEMERLAKACNNTLNQKPAKNSTNDHRLSQQTYNLALLNEKLRQVSITYCYQIEALQSSQRHAYREFIFKLYKQKSDDSFVNLSNLPSKRLNTIMCQERNRQANSFMKKSLSTDSQISQLNMNMKTSGAKSLRRDECFTIYIGTQMKSMHNARILVCDRLSDLCQDTISVMDMADREHMPTRLTNCIDSYPYVEQLFNSRRLQMLMSLYQRDLTGTVLIVNGDPMYHVHNRTHFARLCEQSAELHFGSLEEQLQQVEAQTMRANRTRRCCVDDLSASDLSAEAGALNNILLPGDVYMTCHSNLSSAQVVFHLVTESAMEISDISSRHPCIGGLRNIIKMASRCAVKSITIPLLLVESMNEMMTLSWCVSRAELVFKCLKGFLMEVSLTSTNGAATAARAGFTASAASSATTYYNINFVLPYKISDQLFGQIVDLFSAIFHLVPSLSA